MQTDNFSSLMVLKIFNSTIEMAFQAPSPSADPLAFFQTCTTLHLSARQLSNDCRKIQLMRSFVSNPHHVQRRHLLKSYTVNNLNLEKILKTELLKIIIGSTNCFPIIVPKQKNALQ